MKSSDQTRLSLAILTALLLIVPQALADSEVLEFEGHLYQRLDFKKAWREAQESCEGWNGHLVTIGSSPENEFIFDNFVAPGFMPWLGGTDDGTEGAWRWVTGEPWSYTNWWPGQPDNYSGADNFLAMGDHRKDVWDDDSYWGTRSYICEWDTSPPERVLQFAQFGTGETLQFDLVLANPSRTVAATGEVRFWDPGGNPLNPADFLSGDVDFEIPPQGSKILSTSGTGGIVTGSITVHSNLPLSGVVRFFLPGAGLAGVGPSEPEGSLIVPVRRKGNLSSGVAIRNASPRHIQVDLMLKDGSGKVVANGTALRDIAMNGRVSEFLEQYFPGAETTSFEGTMLVEVRNGTAVVIALELELGGANPKFTTLPVAPVSHEPFLPDLTPRRPEDWSSKIVVSRTAGTHVDVPDLTFEDTLYVDYAVLNHGKATMLAPFQTDLLIDDVLFASEQTEPPLNPGEWVLWEDRLIGNLSPGTHSITVHIHGVPGSDYTDSVYTKFVTVKGPEVNGKWSGTTSQERPLSFEVEEDRVTLVTLDVRVVGTVCSSTISGGIRKIPGDPVIDGSFTWDVVTPQGTSIVLSGEFTSSTEASGTLKVTSQTCQGTADLTWTAVKE